MAKEKNFEFVHFWQPSLLNKEFIRRRAEFQGRKRETDSGQNKLYQPGRPNHTWKRKMIQMKDKTLKRRENLSQNLEIKDKGIVQNYDLLNMEKQIQFRI